MLLIHVAHLLSHKLFATLLVDGRLSECGLLSSFFLRRHVVIAFGFWRRQTAMLSTANFFGKHNRQSVITKKKDGEAGFYILLTDASAPASWPMLLTVSDLTTVRFAVSFRIFPPTICAACFCIWQGCLISVLAHSSLFAQTFGKQLRHFGTAEQSLRLDSNVVKDSREVCDKGREEGRDAGEGSIRPLALTVPPGSQTCSNGLSYSEERVETPI
jgi:hypothetical protein